MNEKFASKRLREYDAPRGLATTMEVEGDAISRLFGAIFAVEGGRKTAGVIGRQRHGQRAGPFSFTDAP